MEEFIQNLFNMTSGVFGGLIMGLAYLITEAAKGFVPKFASTKAAFKRSVIIVGAGCIGLALSFIPEIAVMWYVGLIVGLMAGAGNVAIRHLGKNGPARKNIKTLTTKGFATVRTMVIATAIALLAVFAMGCGTTFTAAKGELVTMDIKASQPGYITAYISGIETCKINVPDGMVTIKNVCANGRVPTLSPFGEVICIVNPCSTGTLIFQNNGMTTCK